MSHQVGDTALEKTIEHEVSALTEEYRRVSTQVSEHSKLQYQLVGVVYAIGGTALSLWGSSSSQPQPLAILFFPPLFCAIVFVQLYLHSSIKSSARYINFRLRPRMEAIINAGLPQQAEHRKIWDWEEYYVHSHRVARFIIRQLGSVIIVLALLPAVGAILVYLLIRPTAAGPITQFEQIWFLIDVATASLTFALIVIVKLINERWWKNEKEQQAKQELLKRGIA